MKKVLKWIGAFVFLFLWWDLVSPAFSYWIGAGGNMSSILGVAFLQSLFFSLGFIPIVVLWTKK